ncbi:hypothetical protein Moror_7820 [Moniliophthora roreri MCA 2997]|uniref:Uncharacterized protein n=1 Tax=Moniliophthora roreri (strain MCA 2997) TaxID=1381753 RepID=V2XCC8_MONRO|nr:hypothetical protein Moror_7820 [Moniliophthora roreri MCA 2997]
MSSPAHPAHTQSPSTTERTPAQPTSTMEQALKQSLEVVTAERDHFTIFYVHTTYQNLSKDCSYVRCICKLATFHVGLHALIQAWNLHQLELDDPQLVALQKNEDVEEKRTRERNIESFKILWGLLSLTSYKDLLEETDTMATHIAALEHKADGTHGDDVGNLKTQVAQWLNNETVSAAVNGLIDPKLIVSPTDKSCRGFDHLVTGHLLCSILYNWDNLEIRGKIQKGNPDYSRYANYFIQAFYDPKLINPTNVEQGFLMSPLLVQVFQYIFTSPHSVSSTEDIKNEELTAPQARKPKSKKGKNKPPA